MTRERDLHRDPTRRILTRQAEAVVYFRRLLVFLREHVGQRLLEKCGMTTDDAAFAAEIFSRAVPLWKEGDWSGFMDLVRELSKREKVRPWITAGMWECFKAADGELAGDQN